jgi:hypothetical protein
MPTTVRDVCKYIGTCIVEKPVCVETGSTYAIINSNLMHTTTNNLAEHVCEQNGGVLLSLDVDAGHQTLANFRCPQENIVLFLYGDSENSLKTLNKLNVTVDLLCLDSAEFDEDHAVREFNAIKSCLRKDKHFVLVDDIHNDNSVKYKKIVPILKELGYDYVEINTPTGLFFAAKGYKLPTK